MRNSAMFKLILLIVIAALVGCRLYSVRHPFFNTLGFNAVVIVLEAMFYAPVIARRRDVPSIGLVAVLAVGGCIGVFRCIYCRDRIF
jgi:hypothetical protein